MSRTFDLCIVSGRRPELLEKTLESFGDKVFKNFLFANVFVNLDPFCGDGGDGEKVKRLVWSFFPDAVIYEPEAPSFGAAVIRLWKGSRSDIVLHLEDDWLVMEEITPEIVECNLIEPVVSLSLVHRDQNNRRLNHFHTRRRKIRFMGLPFWWKTINCFSTSPGFFSGDFVRKGAELMDPGLDPEKQFYSGINPLLEKYVKDYKTKFVFGKNTPFLIHDIGREYREKHGILKEIVSGKSLWTPSVRSEKEMK